MHAAVSTICTMVGRPPMRTSLLPDVCTWHDRSGCRAKRGAAHMSDILQRKCLCSCYRAYGSATSDRYCQTLNPGGPTCLCVTYKVLCTGDSGYAKLCRLHKAKTKFAQSAPERDLGSQLEAARVLRRKEGIDTNGRPPAPHPSLRPPQTKQAASGQ